MAKIALFLVFSLTLVLSIRSVVGDDALSPETIDAATEKFKDMAQAVSGTAGDAAQSVSETAGHATDSVSEAAGEAGESISETAGDASESVSETASSWTDWAKDKLRNMGLMSKGSSASSPEMAPVMAPVGAYALRAFGGEPAAAPMF